MPFDIRKEGDQFCVYTQGTDRKHGCHPTRAKAVRQLRALYVNVPEARSASMSENMGNTLNFFLTDSTTVPPLWTPQAGTSGNVTLTAASAPTAPPRDWFFRPEPDVPTPMTYENSGEVYGHLALNESCHRGFMGGAFAECVRPPRSQTDYEQFHLGHVVTKEGERVAVGKITYETDHAPLTADVVAASRHYDNTGSVGAFVRATNGRHGIWLSGALRPDISEAGLVALRANPLSGDWRSLNHNLELVAALAVPVPGFAIPALAAGADGNVEVMALILGDSLDDIEAAEEEEYMTEAAYFRQREMLREERDGITGAVLTAKKRKSLPKSSFAIPEERAYPIHDEEHARNALARSAGKPEATRVRRAVCARYPDMCRK